MDVPFEFVGKIASARAVAEASHIEGGATSARHVSWRLDTELCGWVDSFEMGYRGDVMIRRRKKTGGEMMYGVGSCSK